VRVVDFPSVLGIRNIPIHRPTSQKAFLQSSVPGTPFPRHKCLGGNIPRIRHWRYQDCQVRNPGGSPRNVSWGTYYTPYLGMTVTVRPQFHGSRGLYDFLKNLSFWRRFHPLSLEPKSSARSLDIFRSRTRSFNSPWLNRWGSQEDVLVSKVASSYSSSGTSVAASCSDSSSIVRCVGGCGIHKSSLWGTGLIADGKFGYFTVCLDLLLIPFICVIQK